MSNNTSNWCPAHFACSGIFQCQCHDATPHSALTPYVANLYTAPLPLWQLHNRAGLLCLGCQHLSAERKSEGGKGSSQAQAEKGGHQEGWHFETVISVEPFRRFNVIFGLRSSALWTKFSKAVEGEGENSTAGDGMKPEKERKRLACVTDTIAVLVQPITAWPRSKSCKLSSTGKMVSGTQWPISLSYFTHLWRFALWHLSTLSLQHILFVILY